MNKDWKIYSYKSRESIITEAINRCLKDIYELSFPECKWEEILEKVKEYESKQSDEDRQNRRPIELDGKDGKRYMYPYDFYYSPMEFQQMIGNNYEEIYGITPQWKPYVETVEEYLKNEDGHSVKDIYVKDENGIGHRDYEKVPSLKDVVGEETANKVFELIGYCKDFYKYGMSDLNFFSGGYVFRSPNTNRETVKNAWKQVFDIDIEIPEDKCWMDEYDERLEDTSFDGEETLEKDDELK